MHLRKKVDSAKQTLRYTVYAPEATRTQQANMESQLQEAHAGPDLKKTTLGSPSLMRICAAGTEPSGKLHVPVFQL